MILRREAIPQNFEVSQSLSGLGSISLGRMTTSRSHYLGIEAERLYTPRTSYEPAAKTSHIDVGKHCHNRNQCCNGRKFPGRWQVQRCGRLNLRMDISNGVRLKAEELGNTLVKLLPWLLLPSKLRLSLARVKRGRDSGSDCQIIQTTVPL